MRVKECMSSNVIKVEPDEKISQVANLMKENDIGCIPVCDKENKVVGFITDRDIVIRCVANNENCSNTKVSEVMQKHIIKTTADTDIEEATRVMKENQIRRLPVIDNGKIVGVLSIGDLARCDEISTKEVGEAVERVCEKDCECE